ncbi:hypothetical protein SSS_05574 [Sarcoptes scabiei]|uniref:Uncharacterized protein n=1 Tax=Sarcoptes scabiei TaxID=52283 RepID=A0A834R3S3_SARSC|nr:hypothetical protein SSS_05574 [Sarcoptes scabiei]
MSSRSISTLLGILFLGFFFHYGSANMWNPNFLRSIENNINQNLYAVDNFLRDQYQSSNLFDFSMQPKSRPMSPEFPSNFQQSQNSFQQSSSSFPMSRPSFSQQFSSGFQRPNMMNGFDSNLQQNQFQGQVQVQNQAQALAQAQAQIQAQAQALAQAQAQQQTQAQALAQLQAQAQAQSFSGNSFGFTPFQQPPPSFTPPMIFSPPPMPFTPPYSYPYGSVVPPMHFPTHFPYPVPVPEHHLEKPNKTPSLQVISSNSHKKPVLVISAVNKPSHTFPIKCKSLGFLKAREEQLEGLIRTSKRDCGLDKMAEEKDSDANEKLVPRSVSTLEVALMNPTETVELEQHGKRNACVNPRFIFKTLSRLRKLIKLLHDSEFCPPIQFISRWLMKKLDLQIRSDDHLDEDEDQIQQNHKTYSYAYGPAARPSYYYYQYRPQPTIFTRPFVAPPPPQPVTYLPAPAPVTVPAQVPVTVPAPVQVTVPAPAALAPVPVLPSIFNPTTLLVKPILKPLLANSKLCKSIALLKAREEQLKVKLETSKRSCLISERFFEAEDLEEEFDEKVMPKTDDPMIVKLSDPNSEVELITKRSDVCATPRILFKSISFLRRFIRFLLALNICPPVSSYPHLFVKKSEEKTKPLMEKSSKDTKTKIVKKSEDLIDTDVQGQSRSHSLPSHLESAEIAEQQSAVAPIPILATSDSDSSPSESEIKSDSKQ